MNVVANAVDFFRSSSTTSWSKFWGQKNTGAVSQSEVKETTLNHADTEACMVEVAKSLQFPKPEGGGIVIVSYPFTLSGAE